ncbi:MAG TPA: hypothetical protein P5137_03230 [Candidatus Brocadiia bacterium]|nr:hypothetical protein [Candidatus Brocadiia bacterium]
MIITAPTSAWNRSVRVPRTQTFSESSGGVPGKEFREFREFGDANFIYSEFRAAVPGEFRGEESSGTPITVPFSRALLAGAS